MDFDFSTFDTQLSDAVVWLKTQYNNISTGRAHPALLDSVKVESYGSEQPVSHLATISNEDPRTLRIAPWDKSVIQEIERAIHLSKLPVTVAVDSDGLRVHVPQLTEESKKDLLKVLKQKHEEARVTVRGAKQKVEKELSALKGQEGVSDDEVRELGEDVAEKVKKTNEELDVVYKTKEDEVMKV